MQGSTDRASQHAGDDASQLAGDTPLDLVEQFLSWCADRKNLRPLTVDMYRHALVHYLEFLGDRPLDSVRAEDVEEFASRPRRSGKIGSPATRRREIVTVRLFHDWAAKRGYGASSDAATAIVPKTTPRNPKPVDDDVWVRLWTAELPDDDRLWLGLGYFAGLRRFEIVTLTPSSVDARQGVLTFERKGGSTSPVEYVAMCEVVAEHRPWVAEGWEAWVDLVAMYADKRATDDHLWPDSTGNARLDANRLNKRLERHTLPRAGLSPDAFTPHCLRHSCATNLLRSGVEPVVIADLLSHASVSTTMRYMRTSGQLGRWLKRTKEER